MSLMLGPFSILRNDDVYLREGVGKFARYRAFQIDNVIAVQFGASTLNCQLGLIKALEKFLTGNRTICIEIVCKFADQEAFPVLLCLQ